MVLIDGTELDADLIVYATGFGSMNGWAAKIISQEVADKVGKCWGMGSETAKDPRAMGRRVTQYVETNTANSLMVSWWKSTPVATLFTIFITADKS